MFKPVNILTVIPSNLESVLHQFYGGRLSILGMNEYEIKPAVLVFQTTVIKIVMGEPA
jgi:hypothetical protein